MMQTSRPCPTRSASVTASTSGGQLALGRNVHYYRRLHGWDERTFADKVGISRVSVFRIEHGTQAPSLRTICRLAEVLQVEVYELFTPKAFPLGDEEDLASGA